MKDNKHAIEIAQLGNSILRKRARNVQDVKNPRMQTLIDDLLSLVIKLNGVGLAAPQIGISHRIVIIASHPNPCYPNASMMEPTPLINPRIIAHTDMFINGWEGCLSIPGLRGYIPRLSEITVSYLDRNGATMERRFADFLARIIQHEHDHLDGLLFTDRVTTNTDLITDREYFRLIKKEQKGK